ncbi:MAG: HutD family protein [Actinomycetota bacterium]|nr:HutD family protein [Actinomycetota bacterium]
MNGEPTDRLGLVRFADRPAVPWRNGHGSTRELAKRLLGVVGPDFVWRISVAEVTQDAEFSTFPGVERTIVPIWGQGLGLDVDGAHTDVGLFEPFAFSGQAQTFVQPKGGPSRVLNVMTKTSRMVAGVKVVDLVGGPVSVAGAASWVQLTGAATVTGSRGDSGRLDPLDALVPRQRVRLVHGTGIAALVTMTNYRAFHDAG